MKGPVQDYGFSVGDLENVTFEECGEKCLQNEKCFSFAYNEWKNKCFLKDKKHNASSPIRNKNDKWYSAYLSGDCEKGTVSLICFWQQFVSYKIKLSKNQEFKGA